MRIRFQPTLRGTVFSLLVFALLTGLGAWQIKRLAWKEALLATIQARLNMPPAPLPAMLENPQDWEYRRVTLSGEFLHAQEFRVGPRTKDGVPGFHLVVPFRRAAGGIVMINRGWITDRLMEKAERPQGLMQIGGVITWPRATRFTPANDPVKGTWFWADAPAMARAAHLENTAPVIITIAPGPDNIYPAGGRVGINIRNDHRAYAAFWFGMALLSQIIFILAACRKREE